MDSFIGSDDVHSSNGDLEEVQIVNFTLGEETFAIDINYIAEIIKPEEVTRVPNSKDFIDGVINMRGRISVVVDLARKLGLQKAEYDKNTRLIMINLFNDMIGLRVGSVSETIKLTKEDIKPAPHIVLSKIGGEYLRGIYNLDEDNLIMILEVERVFPELTSQTEVGI